MLETGLKKQPKGLYILFFAEMWERYSFYTVQVLLVLFLVKNLGFSDPQAYALFGTYSGFTYLTLILGGYLADRFLGYRLAIQIGFVFYIIGLFATAFGGKSFFYFTLGCLIAGNGFFKGNVSGLLGTLYEQKDSRRDSGYTLFYLGINLGSLLASFLSSYLAQQYGMNLAFGVAGIGMLFGFLVCLKTFTWLGEQGLPPQKDRKPYYIAALSLLGVFGIAYLLNLPQLSEVIYYFFAGLSLLVVFVIALKEPVAQRYKIFALFFFIFFSIFFWSLYAQVFSSIMLFIERSVDRVIVWKSQEYSIPASMFLGTNPIALITLSPLFAWLWSALDKKGWSVSYAHKFALGLLGLFFCFLFLKIGTLTSSQGMVHPAWVLAAYVFLTLGELCLSPIGLAVISALAPRKLIGFMMGFWFFSLALGFALAGKLATLSAIPKGMIDPVLISQAYSHEFGLYSGLSFVAFLLILVSAPLIRKLSGEVKNVV